jgi:hypothetical protein
LGIQAGRGLVQEQDRRIAQERHRQRHALLHPTRERAHSLLSVRCQAKALKHPRDRFWRGALQAREEVHNFTDGEIFRKMDLLGHKAHEAPRCFPVTMGIAPAKLDRPVIAYYAQEAVQDRGLARAVWAPQRHGLPGLDSKREILYGRDGAEPLGQAAHHDHGVRLLPCPKPPNPPAPSP